MIGVVCSVGWRTLRRSSVEMLVTFAVPIAFFSIFALIFGGQGGDKTPKVTVAIANGGGAFADRLAQALADESTLKVFKPEAKDGVKTPLDRDGAKKLVKDGKTSVAIFLPNTLALAFGPRDEKSASVELFYDAGDAIAPQMVAGLLQKCAMTAAPDLMVGESKRWMETFSGGLTPEQEKSINRWIDMVKTETESSSRPAKDGKAKPETEMALVPVKAVDVVRDGQSKDIISFYAAGIAVMFLLFSAAGGGGTLLEEEESGTLERLLATRLTIGRLLAGKWTWLTLLGASQIVVMFLWGMLVFGVPMRGKIPGFIVMTAATAGAASAFGLLLATACRTRSQLSGISTIVILMMSALGGSMFPRFVMSEGMQKAGLMTFNAWALDGYVKVFWRDAPLIDLWPQAGMLCLMGTVFFVLARIFARRFEAA